MSEYIKREDATDAFSQMYPSATKSFILDRLAEIPAADVEPVVRGTWVEMRDPYGDLTGWIHEECGRETNAATEYCSKCGAKMTFVERSGSGE